MKYISSRILLVGAIFYLFCLTPDCLKAQEVSDSNFKQLINKIRAYNTARRFDISKVLIDSALQFVDAIDDLDSSVYAELIDQRGVVAIGEGDMKATKLFLDSAFHIKQRIKTEDDLQMAQSYNLYGNFNVITSNYIQAFENYQHALTIKEKLVREDPDNEIKQAELALEYGNIGVLYEDLDFLEKASTFYNKGLAIIYNLADEGLITEITARVNLGRVYIKQGLTEKGLEQFTIATKLAESLEIYKEPLLAINYLEAGAAFAHLEDYDTSLEYFERALEIDRALYGDAYLDVPNLLNNIGYIYILKDQHKEAIPYLEEALKIYGKLIPASSQDFVRAQINLGTALKEVGEINKSKEYYENALANLEIDISGNRDLAIVNTPSLALEGLLGISNLYFEIFKVTQDEKSLDEAVGYNLKARQLLRDILQNGQWEPRSKDRLINNQYRAFEDAIIFETARPISDDYNSEKVTEKIFELMELSRSYFLLQALKQTELKASSGKLSDFISRENQIKSELIRNQQLRYEISKSQLPVKDSLIAAYDQEIFSLKQELEQLVLGNKEYYNLKYNHEVINLKEAQSLLNTGQAILEYFLGDESVYAMLITQDQVYLETIPRDFPIENWVPDLIECITGINNSNSTRNRELYLELSKKYAKLAFGIYEKLMLPLEKVLPEKLIIIPDGVLGYLSFDALLTERPSEVDEFRKHKYAIEKYQISYANSATILAELLNRNPFNNTDVLAIAPSFTADDELDSVTVKPQFEPLKHNVDEARSITDMLGGKLLEGENATKKGFKENLEKFGVIHLATHALADDKNGDFCVIAFSEKSSEDDLMYVNELYNLNTKANLVVLSACETGRGEIKRGEGIIGLSRGFTFAGASSIVNSLWEVDDYATSEIMKSFYKELKAGKFKDEALRSAKMDYLSKNPAPFYWASMIPIGNMQPLPEVPPLKWWVIVLIAALIGGMIWFLRNTNLKKEG